MLVSIAQIWCNNYVSIFTAKDDSALRSFEGIYYIFNRMDLEVLYSLKTG